jgi:hypothetical protein
VGGGKVIALSVKQPWAQLIVSGKKDVENRSWRTNYRGRVLIHAGVTPECITLFEQALALMPIRVEVGSRLDLTDPRSMDIWPRGAIVGAVTIVDCVLASDSPWFGGAFGWVLKDAVAFPEPIPYKGRLGLFEVPDELIPTEVAE